MTKHFVVHHWINLFITSPRLEGPCIEWPFGRDSDGYGSFQMDTKHHKAHRFLLAVTTGTTGEIAAHNCHNRACINPAHLRWATAAENASDRRQDGTLPTSFPPRKLTDEQVLEIRGSSKTGSQLAKEFGISRNYANRIKAGKRRL